MKTELIGICLFIVNDYKNELIIIGNGPSVSNRKLGHIIDQFGTVVRLNRFYTSPPTINPSYTGTKTTIWATKRAYPSDVNLNTLKQIIFLLLNHKHTETERRKLKEIANNSKAELIDFPIALQNRNIAKVKKYVSEHQTEVNRYTKGTGKVVPSSGANIVMYFLQERSYVYCHGFDLMRPGGKVHYWSEATFGEFEHVSKANVYPVEKWFFDPLIKQGKIKFL